MHLAYLSLGSNMGTSLELLRSAVERIEKLTGTSVAHVSSVYRAAPIGLLDQPDFLNMAIELQTVLSPYDLLEAIQAIEQELGRERRIHWGPRTIDIDILLYDDLIINEAELVIPHPEMLKRAFVLIPLMELNLAEHIKDVGLFERYLADVHDQLVEKIGSLW